ncbi:MAG: tetratricopeptide repeat protein, partial [bacterium]
MKMFMASRVLKNPIKKARSDGEARGRKHLVRTSIFCFLVASLLLVSACSDPAKAFTRHFERANEYIEQEKFEEARIELFNSLKYKPENVEVLLKLARVQVRLGAFSEAAAAYRVVLKSDPDNRDVAVEYSQLLHAGKAYPEVKRVLSGILENNPNDPEVLLLLSASLARLGEQEKALALAEQAASIKPAELSYWLNLVQVRMIGRDFKGAEKALAKADSISPGHASVQLARIELSLAQRQFDEAIALFKELISDNPENRVYRIRYASLLETLGRDEEARKGYEELIEEEDDAVIRNRLGLLLMRLKDGDGAAENWTRAMEMRETYIDPRLNLARLHLARNENEKALSLAEGILEMDSENPAGLVMRAMVRLKNRDYGKSIPDLQKALEANPKNVTGRFLLAQAQLGSGERQAARISYREVLKAAPDHKRA